MASPSDSAARGKVIRAENGLVVFAPAGTSYEMHLAPAGAAPEPADRTVACLIRATARKIWTVPSGGNFIVPIAGPPKIIQGRIKWLDEQSMLVQAGGVVMVSLPKDPRAYDLVNGPLTEGTMVNATLLPGASAEFI